MSKVYKIEQFLILPKK